MLEKKLIQRADVMVFPIWMGGGVGYIDREHPLTGKKITFGHWASEAMKRKWENRLNDMVNDENSILVVVSDCGTSKWYAKNNNESYRYNKKMKKMLGKRCIIVEEHTVDSHEFFHKEKFRKSILKRLLNARRYCMYEDTQVYGYGHHWGDCVPNIGREATKSSELPIDNFHALHDLSVLCHKGILERTVHKYNEALYNEIVRHPDVVVNRDIFNYFFNNKSPLEVKHIVKKTGNLKELLMALGESFYKYCKIRAEHRNQLLKAYNK
ncbi:MAG: hypothetical protein Q7J54_06085 [Candidatus Woesearchaeota archaeon]|nr:hypothetical protein [Candidatus Woesearchaeota archaeon]